MAYQAADLSAWGIDSHVLRPGNAERRLLFALAHPDDESFGSGGTIANYARQGVAVDYVCATRGECGTVAPELLNGYADIAELRSAELNTAAHALGMASYHFLNYRDSGMQGAPENQHPRALHATPLDEVTGKVVAAIRVLRPQVVVTFNPYGGYGHPDHIAIHHATLKAFDLAAESTAYPEQLAAGLELWQPQKLYYGTFNPRMVRWLVRVMPLLGVDPRRAGQNNDMDFVRVVEEVTPVTATIHNAHVADELAASWRAHRSQLGGMNVVLKLPRFLRRMWNNTDTYTRVYPAPDAPETDLFAGVHLGD